MTVLATTSCPQCGKMMINVRSGEVLLTYPEQHKTIWWCECGYRREGEVERDITQEEYYLKLWKGVNE